MRLRHVTLALLAALPLTGCASAVVTTAAPAANNPLCASAMLKTPETISGRDRRDTTSQGNTAYGDPADIVVRCGVDAPGPTSQKCLAVDGVDWLVVEEQHPGQSPSHTWRATTYGTEPTLEVVFNADTMPSSDVLPTLSAAAGALEKKRSCQ
ncbi:DUF3515 family protein [Falsarthrobacter nasiphocae]|uniref:DUF3515 domain-containing protein n=1 Tax=Falsarthrobacter nasiphocae TaxID=189863 RepID=A0AAE4C8X3_9MICC|nr:DUF3515 family protein [Falsarthrobacter nasiphocae]MDR6892840.1 hypothetical protein [Falsarthrobacter nasiphocae]